MIRAELYETDDRSSHRCTALGLLSAACDTPVLRLCRMLVAAGHDPSEPMEVYRGEVLALTVRSIGEGAKLTVNGSTRFARYRPGASEEA
jgi:hypothetical protein